MKKFIFVLASIVFVVALPPALAFSNFRWFVLDPANYLNGQERHSVSRDNGITPLELEAVDSGLVRYFQSDRDSLQPSLEQAGVARSPFSERDVAHLKDVHDMINGVLRIQWLAVAFALVFLVVAIVAGKWRLAAKAVAAGSLLTIALLGILGLLSILDWESLFLEFHFLSFSNDLWRLDPARDALIRLYPPNFFMDTTIQIVLMSIVEALVLAGLSGLVLYRKRARGMA